jgi:hypothetical protein
MVYFWIWVLVLGLYVGFLVTYSDWILEDSSDVRLLASFILLFILGFPISLTAMLFSFVLRYVFGK